jgi:hypothetical protein
MWKSLGFITQCVAPVTVKLRKTKTETGDASGQSSVTEISA